MAENQAEETQPGSWFAPPSWRPTRGGLWASVKVTYDLVGLQTRPELRLMAAAYASVLNLVTCAVFNRVDVLTQPISTFRRPLSRAPLEFPCGFGSACTLWIEKLVARIAAFLCLR